jgi:hypothetical protein
MQYRYQSFIKNRLEFATTRLGVHRAHSQLSMGENLGFLAETKRLNVWGFPGLHSVEDDLKGPNGKGFLNLHAQFQKIKGVQYRSDERTHSNRHPTAREGTSTSMPSRKAASAAERGALKKRPSRSCTCNVPLGPRIR